MKRIRRFLTILILVVLVGYFIGPKPKKPEMSKDLPSIPASIGNIEKYVTGKDEGVPVKKDNESRIIWANDSKKERTNFSVLYLHGFSASWYEGYPVHVRFAAQFGANLYIPRLASHGVESEDALIDMTPDRLWNSAKDALMVARSLGKKVIIMGTSTGATLALHLAAQFPEYVEGLILYSPNIEINERGAFLLSKPWGLQIGRKVNGGKHKVTSEDFDSKDCQYWNCRYRMEAAVYLQQLLDVTMKKENFKRVVAPVFVGYYFKDKTNQDNTVKVGAMKRMLRQLGTADDKKWEVAFPNAGEHVIASELTSGAVEDVIQESVKFGKEVLKLKPAR